MRESPKINLEPDGGCPDKSRPPMTARKLRILDKTMKLIGSDLPSQICINNMSDRIIHGIFPSISVEKFPAFQDWLLVEIHP